MQPTLPASATGGGAAWRWPVLRHHPIVLALGTAALVHLTGLALPGPTIAQRPEPAALEASPAEIDVPAPARQLQQFALNALLAPLMDDDLPARWTDVAVRHFCGPETRIEVDGQPMQPGAPVPSRAFTLRWHIDACWPFDAATPELSGDVELLVFREDDGLGAVVQARGLRLAGPTSTATLPRMFAASLALETGTALPR